MAAICVGVGREERWEGQRDSGGDKKKSVHPLFPGRARHPARPHESLWRGVCLGLPDTVLGCVGRLAWTEKRGWALHISDTSFFIPSTVALPFPPLLPPYPDANRRRRRRHTATDFADFFGEIGYPLAAGGSSVAPSTTGAPSSPATSRSLVAPSLHARCSTVRLNDVRFLSFGSSAISFSCLVCLTRRHG